MKKVKRIVVVALLLILVAGNTALVQGFSVHAADTEEVDTEEVVEVIPDTSYKTYIERHAESNKKVPELSLKPAVENILGRTEKIQITQKGEYGSEIPAVYIEEGGSFELTVYISKEGLYQIGTDYYPVEGRGQDIKQSLKIDGEYPFEEAEQFLFSRVWKESEIKTDADGNDLYPGQVQSPEWITAYLQDSNGYYSEPFLFYFTEGEHTLKFTSIEEPLLIRSVLLSAEKEILSYEKALKGYRAAGYSEVSDYFYKKQAEEMDKKSSSMLSAVTDRSDPCVEPYDGLKIKLNVLGGGRFDTDGMWVEYTVEVPSDGLYRLVFKTKQNNMKNQSAYRNIYINGEIPFEEAKNFPFEYSVDYKNVVFGNEDGAYLVKLNAGENTIRLEASLGDISEFCSSLENSLKVLNAAYRNIVTITGTTPDVNRDYSLDSKMPDVIEIFKEQYEILSGISEQMKERYGKSTSYTAAIDALVLQLERMYENHYDIPMNVSSFNSNLSTLGSKVEEMKQTDITLDYIMIAGTENKLPKPMAGFFQKILFSIRNFFASFFNDYSMIGASGDYEQTIDVWMIGGREQAQILKQIINADFSEKYGIGVNVKLISDVNTLQQATMAGEGPDVAIGVPQSSAMNFAFRGATLDLSEMEGFDEIADQFADSAIDVLTYNGGVMGIPQTMDFQVLFYREDILQELNMEVPETWDDIYALLPVLAQNNMTFGLPVSSASEGTQESINSFGALLYQRGGKYYNDDLLSVTFSNELTINTISDWSDLYISYGLPISYSFVNRFAAGDMPIAVQNYSTYNTLILYAPQLSSSWKWTTIPGTIREDGSIDHSVPISVTASVILADTQKEESSWNFIKWWTSKKTQVEFGRSIENLLGKAGRYNTANIAAIEEIPWSGIHYKELKEQLSYTVAVPEIPGGYYTGRYLNNAFWEIYDNSTEGNSEVRKVMYQYDQIVDNELVYQKEALKKAAESENTEN